jgi:hypothetical protein
MRLIKTGFGLATGFIGHATYNTWLHLTLYSIMANSQSLEVTKHALSPLGLLSFYQPSVTNFQRRSFRSLCYWTIPLPQPQRLTVRSPAWTTSSFHLLPRAITNNWPSGALSSNCLLLSPTVLSGTLSINWLLLKFKLYCDWRSVGQFVLVSGPLWGLWPDFNFLCLTIKFFLLPLTRGRTCNLQYNHALVRVAQDQ